MGMFLMTLLMITGVLLMFIVLLQRGRGGGLAGAFGGAGGQSAFGTRAGDVFTKITVGLAIVWVVLAGLSGFALRADAKSKYRGESPETPEVKAKDDSKEKSSKKSDVETPSEDKTDEKESTETKSGDNAKPADSEKPTTDSPTTDKPAEDKPSKEKPSTETPADEKPSDEKPTNEKSSEKKAGDKPTEDKKTDGEKPPETEKKPE